ncbi:MAG: hypothetical protein KGZ25_11035 [Planctomycetes bacterium]|nr:hypothetical protein [Planctomycetota bacterium]
MQARETTRIVLRFTGPLSPWWLLVLLPGLLVLGWYLYKRQIEGLGRGTAMALLGMRGLLLAGLLVLILRPNLVHRRVLRYPGRILVAVDNSESMSTADNSMSPSEALYLARKTGGVGDRGAVFHQGAAYVEDAVIRLKKFERYSAENDRNRDVFWQHAETVKGKVRKPLRESEKLISAATVQSDSELPRQLANLREGLSKFFSGGQHPGASAFESYYSSAGKVIDLLLKTQQETDRKRLAEGQELLEKRIKAIRSKKRISMLTETLAELPETAAEFVPDQGLEIIPLIKNEKGDGDSFDLEKLEIRRGRTDILGPLQALTAEDSEFPLSGVILFSDGRQLATGSIESVVQNYSRRNVPVFCGTVGSTREPFDIALLEVISPPFAVTDVETRIKVRVKTSLKKPQKVEFRILRRQQTVCTRQIMLGPEPVKTVELSFTPSEEGVFRYTVEIEGAAEESFPIQNNTVDFALHVRSEKIRVLFLDWKPRWETRFALNIFRRLDYVELNSIIAVVQKGGKVRRGVEKGTWPEDKATLGMYDLVVLGEKAKGILNKKEWQALHKYVVEDGGTICLMSSDVHGEKPGSGVIPGDLEEELLPVASKAMPEQVGSWDWSSPTKLRVGRSGIYHPTARELAAELTRFKGTPKKFLSTNAFALVQLSDSGAPVIATRVAGTGKVFLVGNENLWKAFNPTILGAHTRLYVGLVSWAIEGGPSLSEESASIFLDQRSALQRDGMQVWVWNAPKEAQVEAMAGEEIVARAPAEKWSSDPPIKRAVFDRVPPRNLVFRLQKIPKVNSPSVVVTEQYDELAYLSINKQFMEKLAVETGGFSRPFVEFKHFLASIKPKERVQTEERIWQLWDFWLILLFAGLLMTVEWVWRKFVGLV